MGKIVELLVWWVLLTALELMLISSVDRAEVAIAVALGLAAALAAVGARAAQPASWAPRASWLGWLLHLPAAVLHDSATVLVAAAAGRRGAWRRIPVGAAVGDDARGRAGRALAGLVLSTAPGTVVVDVDPRDGTALLHDLGSRPRSGLERAVAP